MAYVLLAALVVGVLLCLASFVINAIAKRRDGASGMLKVRNAELKNERAKNRIAVKALRNIANGTSGLPVLDAQIALDDIESREDKELN